ncbi:MAG: hypothetical protein RL701_2827 [Pseudomonadota bacterium]
MSPAADTEEATFRALIARHTGALERVARHYEVSNEARGDLAQEILVALWRAHGNFRGDSSERTWVYRIAHNVAVSHVARAIRTRRDAAALASVPQPDPEPGPDEVTQGRQALRRLERLIFQLDVQSRQLVLLALEGCSTAEIAEVTGLSATNVTTRLSRLRKQLAEVEP